MYLNHHALHSMERRKFLRLIALNNSITIIIILFILVLEQGRVPLGHPNLYLDLGPHNTK